MLIRARFALFPGYLSEATAKILVANWGRASHLCAISDFFRHCGIDRLCVFDPSNSGCAGSRGPREQVLVLWGSGPSHLGTREHISSKRHKSRHGHSCPGVVSPDLTRRGVFRAQATGWRLLPPGGGPGAGGGTSHFRQGSHRVTRQPFPKPIPEGPASDRAAQR